MTGFPFRRPTVWLMAGLLGIAALVRFRAIGFGLPHTQARPDETAIIEPVRTLLSGHLPHFYDYPWLFLWMVAIAYVGYYLWGAASGSFHSLSEMVASWPVRWEPFFLIPRVISATAGTLTVAMVFRLGRRLGHDAIGIVAALFLALAYMHTRSSHFGTTDIMMTLFIVIAVVQLLDAHRTRSARGFAAAGLWAGLATGTKYNAVLLVVPMLVSHTMTAWDARAEGRTGWTDKGILYFGVAFAFTFAIGVPFVILDHTPFRGAMYELLHALQLGDVRQDLGNGWWHLLTNALRYGLGLPMLLAGLTGAVMLCRAQPRTAAIVLSFPIAYYALAGSIRLLFFRYAMPLVPFLCVTAAYFVCQAAAASAAFLSDRPAVRRLAATGLTGALAIALIWPSGRRTWAFDRVMSERDNRVVVAQWFFDHVATESSVLQTGSRYGLVQFWDRRFHYPEWRWDPVRRVFILDNTRLSKTDRPDWIIVQDSPLPNATQEVVKEMLHDYEKVADFPAFSRSDDLVYDQLDAFFVPFSGLNHVTRPGPNFSVYKRLPAVPARDSRVLGQ